MIDQVDKCDPQHDIYHESNHSMLIFRIRNAIPKLRVKTISLPETEEKREQFKTKVSEYIAAGTGSKIDIHYEAVNNTCRDLKLITTHKGFRRLKF